MNNIEKLNAEAAECGHPELKFEYHGSTIEECWRDETVYPANLMDGIDLLSTRQVVEVLQYHAYGPAYGVWVQLSQDTELLDSGYYVIHSSDGTETNGKPYEDMYDALRYMDRLISDEEEVA